MIQEIMRVRKLLLWSLEEKHLTPKETQIASGLFVADDNSSRVGSKC